MPLPTLFRPLSVRRAFRVFAALAIINAFVLNVLGGALQTGAAPLGILSFEFAGDRATALAIIDSWNERTRLLAGVNLGLDYLFLFLYSHAIAFGCWLTGQKRSSLLRWAYVLAALQMAAAVLDGIENFGLLQLLLGNPGAGWAPLAFWCAGFKFLFVGAGILFVAAGLFIRTETATSDR